jgi:tetratricopeptide (TPR) repeat protein
MTWIVAFVLGLAWPLPVGVQAHPAGNWYIQTLDSYASGDYQRFDRELHANAAGPAARLAFLAQGIEKAGPSWIAGAPPEQRDRRRLVVAAVSLELANEAGLNDWPQARALIEWACALVRKNARPAAAERTWQWAAVAVFEGAADAAVLQSHVAHALQRFPGDHRFMLARAVAAELRTWPDPRDGHTPRERNATGVGVTVTRFNEARRFDDVRAEAAVHLGFMALRNGDALEALPYFREAAAASPDPFVVHLLHLFRGRALERLIRMDEAIEEYRAAIAAAPGQTARLALASALARSGRPQDGVRMAAEAVGGTSSRVDPWVAYGRGDARMWPEILQRLRRELAEPAKP